jgi:hypothetical protein
MRFAVCKNLKGRLKAKLNLVVNGRFQLVLALIAAAAKPMTLLARPSINDQPGLLYPMAG